MGGGTALYREAHGVMKGLSPHVRGNQVEAYIRAGRNGSIPARAGEPFYPNQALRFSRVYPRACGGTAPLKSSGVFAVGLSPRVRGNQKGYALRALHVGSIPARAGEPR